MAQKPDASPPPEVKLHYIDRPDLAETFADSINALFFDGQTLRIEVGVSRVENSKNDEPIMVRRCDSRSVRRLLALRLFRHQAR